MRATAQILIFREYTDLETNTIYLRNRYYNPTTGRFLVEDPIRNGLNYYTYCSNNPIAFIDPWGLADIAVRSTIEGLGGTVTWNDKTKKATVYLDGQKVEVYVGDGNGTYIDKNGRMHKDDGKNSPGDPPPKVQESLKDKKGWDWNGNENDWINKCDIYLDAAGVYVVTYPNRLRPFDSEIVNAYLGSIRSNTTSNPPLYVVPGSFNGPIAVPSFLPAGTPIWRW